MAYSCAKATPATATSNEVCLSSSFKLLIDELDYNSLVDRSTLKSNELYCLFAICDSSEHFKNERQIDILFPIITKYLLITPNLRFKSLTAFKSDDLTPWTKMTYELASGLINFSKHSRKLENALLDVLTQFIQSLELNHLFHQFVLLGLTQAFAAHPFVVSDDFLNVIISIFNNDLYDNIETTLHSVTDQEEIDIIYSFNDLGLEYSSVFFIETYQAFIIEYLKCRVHAPTNGSLMDYLLNFKSLSYSLFKEGFPIMKAILKTQYEIEDYIETSSDRITKSTVCRRKNCLTIRALALEIFSLNTVIANMNFEFVSNKVSTYLDEFITSIEEGSPAALDYLSSNMLYNLLGTSAILSEEDQILGLNILKYFPVIIQAIIMPKSLVKKLCRSIIYCMQIISKDDLISLIYTLVNMITVVSQTRTKRSDTIVSSMQNHSLNESSYVRNDLIIQNFITAVIELGKAYEDEDIVTLVSTLLYQKIKPHNDEMNAIILEALSEFVDRMSKKEFYALLKYYYDVSNLKIMSAAAYDLNVATWVKFSKAMAKSTNGELYDIYLSALLMQITSKGDIDDLEHHRPNQSVTESAKEIIFFLKPLAHSLPNVDEPPRIPKSRETIRKFQDAWFNLAVHGFAYNSTLYKECLPELLRIAHSTPPLASEITWNRSETSIEMNTILRRGTSKTTERIHKDILKNIITMKTGSLDTDSQISRPGLMFLSSTLMVEMLRTNTGDFSKILEYLSDPSVIIAKHQSNLSLIAFYCMQSFVNDLASCKTNNGIKKLISRLKEIFVFCCHRNAELQSCAFRCADIILSKIPSALCYEESTFSLLDILALLFQSIIDADTNEYEPMTQFKSRVTDINLLLSDSYQWRQATLDRFTANATKWITKALVLCDADMKAVLRSYVMKADATHRTINYGVSFALDMASKILSSDREFFQLQGLQSKRLNTTAGFLSQTPWYSGLKLLSEGLTNIDDILLRLDHRIESYRKSLKEQNKDTKHHKYTEIMEDVTNAIILLPFVPKRYFDDIVELPFCLFDSYAMEHAIFNWLTVMRSKPQDAEYVLSLVLMHFEKSIVSGKGLYSRANDLNPPEFCEMEYLPTNKAKVSHQAKIVSKSLKPHLLLIRFLASHFQATLYQNTVITEMFTNTILLAVKKLTIASLHPFSRLLRSELINFGCEILRYHIVSNASNKDELIMTLLDGALSWFVKEPSTPFGNNKLKIKADYQMLSTVASYFAQISFKNGLAERKRHILLWFLDDELELLNSWLNAISVNNTAHNHAPVKLDERLVSDCYAIDGHLAVNLVVRHQRNGSPASSLSKTLRQLIIKDPYKVSDYPVAMQFISDLDLTAIVVWAAAAPVDAINMFLPPYSKNPFIIQYAMRSIESFDVHLTFFYVPQIVQTLRHDDKGYIRRFILETANVSQLFAHQIIWNMAANSYKDEDSKVPDPIKPVLDEIRETMIASFSESDREYFEKEFSFFNEVTGISGKLKPFIKKSKPEKKAKIDQEMALIKVEEGVYLPSNPDGTVVDIDRKSGKPLQSHAKAPFLATFFIKKKKDLLEVESSIEDEENDENTNVDNEEAFEIVKTSAIFKVGDDCRQDVLALQLISVFRTIWMNAGVDVYVFPYRVTATAPGCGIIDVLPNSISRDMLGREAVNGLYEYFISQFGPETSPEFQRARINFVKSLAAYSMISFLLQFKDRHNGNIMYDNEGHILHIDFGFCFDIVPGGVKFEQSPFKLTREMVRVMGGNVNTQAYKWFEELCVKSFLACRLHMDAIIKMVIPMMESGLPCFKPATIKHLTQRFVPHKNDKEAAAYVRSLIRKSYESFATKGYDEFQRITNGIPY